MKRRKVPGTYKTKMEDLISVAMEHADGPGFYMIDVCHDDDCRSLETQSLADCTCEPEIRPPKKQ